MAQSNMADVGPLMAQSHMADVGQLIVLQSSSVLAKSTKTFAISSARISIRGYC